jgi:hypothetical protein
MVEGNKYGCEGRKGQSTWGKQCGGQKGALIGTHVDLLSPTTTSLVAVRSSAWVFSERRIPRSPSEPTADSVVLWTKNELELHGEVWVRAGANRSHSNE